MADITDLIRALNAPPALGEFSAARTQPWMNGSIGMGPGAQLIMKDPAGVEAAANRWTRARAETSPYAGVIWGDTVGGAQNTVLNERARQVQIAMQREQMAAQQAREARLMRQAEMEQATRQQIGQQNFLSRLAQSAATAQGRNAQALENAARLRQLEQVGGQITAETEDAEGQLAALQSLLRGNAEAAVAGNPDLDFREGPDGLPAVYSPSNRANANDLRSIQSAIFGRPAPGAEGPAQFDFDPMEEYNALLSQLGALDQGRRAWQQDYGAASRRPMAMIDTTIFDEFAGAGGVPTVGQSAAELLMQAQARGNAYRLPSGPTGYQDLGAIRPSTYRAPSRGAQPRWSFDPQSRRII